MDDESLQRLLAEIAIMAIGMHKKAEVTTILAYLAKTDASAASIAMIQAIQGLAERRYNDVLLLLRPMIAVGTQELLPFATLAAQHLGLGNEAEALAKQALASKEPALVAFAENFFKER